MVHDGFGLDTAPIQDLATLFAVNWFAIHQNAPCLRRSTKYQIRLQIPPPGIGEIR